MIKKLVVLKLDGNFDQGFRVSLSIGEDGSIPNVELSDNELKLPPLPTLPEIYQDWSSSYRSLDGYRIKPKKGQITHVRFQSVKQECHHQAEIIKQSFITWLQADSFRLIKEQCLTQLTPGDEVRVIIRTTEYQLRKLPWHLWDLFECYPHAEVAFSSLSAQRFNRSERSNIRILIILGNSEGINVAEDEKVLKQYCQKAEIIVLVEPTPVELNIHLWDKQGWDILFFSGHSRTESAKGRIFLNRRDSLTMDELRYGLQTAVMRGLQLACVTEIRIKSEKKTKRSTQAGTERVLNLRLDYWEKVKHIEPENLVFLDETGVLLGLTRTHARSQKGTRAY